MKLRLCTLFILLALLIGACGQVPASGDASSEEGGGTVVLVIPEEPAGLNRYLADAALLYQVSDATLIGP